MRESASLPFRNFHENIARARAVTRFDGYLQDVIENAGKKTIGPLMELPNELMKVTGMDTIFHKAMKGLEVEVKKGIKERATNLDSGAVKDRALQILRPYLKKLQQIITDLGLVLDSTLPEQGLVLAVSAFEVYLREIAVWVVSRDVDIRRKFRNEIEGKLTPERLEEYGQDARRTPGEIVGETMSLEPRRLRKFFERLLGIQNIFEEEDRERKFARIVESRHLIIHRAGVIDPKFKKITRHRGTIDTQLRISRTYVLQSIRLLEALAGRMESKRARIMSRK